jgi:2-polyprenyl-3-methyl-5-hydroxy-6-metoxy-1,4-benzoquinol methylase
MSQENDDRESKRAWQQPWPADELEFVEWCPVCGSRSRELLQENLVDEVFGTAPGRWNLHRCRDCRSAYLDPRPSEASIGRAYEVYYTHAPNRPRNTQRRPGLWRRLASALTNGYLNARYGTRRQPATRLGVGLAWLLRLRRQKRDAEFRWLPRPGAGWRLLDIGCGNGDFLLNAQDAGWLATGVDSDPKAVEVAQQRGLEVRLGGIELFAGQAECFDAITLSHVLEHAHQPGQLIQSACRLLKPGGILFVDTPNIESHGARCWGSHWRGLETPRHLAIFSREGLVAMLRAGGFGRIEHRRRTAVKRSMDLASLRMQRGHSPYGREPARLPLRLRLRLRWPLPRMQDDEFLTLLAWKAPH